ncbi:type II secretion system F family protein [Arthrobacter silvisoli]|uniref:type II secretion system F family protein n=1 Tax=Arthrobacter silvisoli TaxID=2291022 RepID=UPI001FE9D66C|nr:type II secretion system F family protein [Arthrobacter silvisoli]
MGELLPAAIVAAVLFMAAVLAFPGSGRTRRRAVIRRLRSPVAGASPSSFTGSGPDYGPGPDFSPGSRALDAGHLGRGVPGQHLFARFARFAWFRPGGTGSGVRRYAGLESTAIMLELAAAALDSGAGLGRALDLIASCSAPAVRDSLRPVVAALAIGADWETAWRSSAVQNQGALRLRDSLAFAARTGAPSSAVLYAQAARLRREDFRSAERRAAALGVKLVVPLGLCSLPAFICLGVVPVLLAMLPSGS